MLVGGNLTALSAQLGYIVTLKLQFA